MASLETGHRPGGGSLLDLEQSVEGCSQCGLAATRTRVVFGSGNPDADLMFVGEAPGFHEDQQGEPFVGQAGRLLSELLGEIGLERGDVYIANVLKCRPPNNRDPQPDEISSCEPNLHRQIQLIRPQVICTLGRFATRLLADTRAGISAVRGRAKQVEIAGVPVIVFPVFHPAAALYTPANRQLLSADFKRLTRLLTLGGKALKGVDDAVGLPPEAHAAQAETVPHEDGSVSVGGEAEASSEAGRDERVPHDRQLPLW